MRHFDEFLDLACNLNRLDQDKMIGRKRTAPTLDRLSGEAKYVVQSVLSRNDRILFYFVVDESSTATESGWIQAANEMLPELHYTIFSVPEISTISRMSIIAFSQSAEVTLHATPVTEIQDLLGFEEGGPAHFGPALRKLSECLELDIRRLKEDGARVIHSCVMFLTASTPVDGDDWHAELELLQRSPHKPFIIAFGVHNANLADLQRIGHDGVCTGHGGESPSRVLENFICSIYQEGSQIGSPDE